MTAVHARDRETAQGWHTLEGEAVLAAMDSSVGQGLSTADARLRLAQYGPNVLAEGKRRGPMRMLLAQFADVMVLVLIGAAVVAGFLGEPQDIVAIVAIVLLNAVLGFVQEYRAERAMAALKRWPRRSARVRRDGAMTTVPATELVPGDVVLLEAGNVVPADLRLIEASSFESRKRRSPVNRSRSTRCRASSLSATSPSATSATWRTRERW